MATTYKPISTNTLTSATSSVDFTSISGSYTDLIIVVSGIASSGGTTGVLIRLNSDTGTNYSATQLDGDGSIVGSYRDTNFTSMNIGLLSGTHQSNSIIHIMNYANTTTYKTLVTRGNDGSGYIRVAAGMWRNTSAVTSVTLYIPSVNFASGTTFTLYGIKAA